MNIRVGRKIALLASVSVLSVTPAYTQDSATADESEEIEEVIVVGSHIKGAKVTDMLPVAVLDSGDIETTGTVSGNELFRSIPQMGFQAVNNEDTSGGINAARGDVASINLRALGTGNTLMLLNGRRMVLHPGYQTENLVPVSTVNTNTIPVMGVKRLELLLGGAAAIYGADAVGGVVNTVLEDDYEGITGELRYGFEEGTSLAETSFTMKAGFAFNEGKTNLQFFGSYFDREGVWASERERFNFRDQRPLVEGDPDWEGDSNFNNTSSWSSWGRFDTGAAAYDLDGNRLTSKGGSFHMQPIDDSCEEESYLPGSSGLCVDAGSHSSNQRYDWNPDTKMSPDIERVNAFSYLTHDFDNGMEFYGEAGYYNAKSLRNLYQGSVLGSHRFWVPASSYWNPFGPTTLADGSPNPNRLPNLDIAPEGRDIFIDRYRPIDAGTRDVNVKLESYRFVAGLRGTLGDWDFDTGFVQSESKSTDTTNRVSNTKFAEWISRTDPTAYNIWNGGDPNNLSGYDTAPASPESLAGIMVDVSRVGKTSLTLADFKVSRGDLFTLPAGDVGAAFGVEYRRESYSDDRDDRLDGTITFTDPVTGDILPSDVLGSSPTNDSNGNRKVISLFGELAIPVLRDAPMFESLDIQIAARYEDLSDVGSTFKPKIGMSWYPTSGIQFRGSWSKGFRAPNLPQINETSLSRVNTRTDYIRCAAVEITTGTWECGGQSLGVESRRSGSKELNAEKIDNKSLGITLQPDFLPGLTLTADWWRIEQQDLVSIFTDYNAIILDYKRRVVDGTSNPNVVRAAADADDDALFAGTGIDSLGQVLYVIDPYQNLDSRVVKGMDFAIYYDFETDNYGDFKFKINAAKLNEFWQSPSADAQEILDAQEAGLISDKINVAGAGSLLQENARPEWRFSSSLRWKKGDFGANLHASYVDWVWDTSATQNGVEETVYWKIKSHFKVNTSVHYDINEKARLRIGVNNLFDKLPPLADEAFGYNSDLHSARGRYIYGSIRLSM